MKKSIVIFITAVCLLITGCGDTGSLSKLPSSSFHEDKQKLTIMHIDADNKRFQDFIEETEKKLDMEITVEKCPSNADNRQAKISTILASGDKNIDLISVNDEMISEFKHKGYLEPLEKNVMTEEVRDSFPQKYLESICEENGHIYSVPFQMDIMMFWVNQELLKQAGLDEIKNTGDFDILQKSNFSTLLDYDVPIHVYDKILLDLMNILIKILFVRTVEALYFVLLIIRVG